MIKATIHNIQFFENFLGVINKFVQQCEFVVSTKDTKVFCKNQVNFSSARLLLDSNIFTLNEGQKYDKVNICIRDVIAFKSAISIVNQVEEVESIEVALDDVEMHDDIFVKSIKYKSKSGNGSFNLISIDFDVIRDFVSKDSSIQLKKNWIFNVNPKNLDIAQNRTNAIVNLDEVSVYIYPDKTTKNAIVELASKKTASMNSIAIPISDSSEGSLDGLMASANGMVCIHESSFRIFNILRVTKKEDIECFFNVDNNVFFITSKLVDKNWYINSRLFIQMILGK